MGQQQLLVLGIVIVGLAVVAGINAFDENQTKSSQDALTQEAFRLATDAKAYYNKPTQFAGAGGTASNLSGISWSDIGVGSEQLSGDAYDTPWGTIGIGNASSGNAVQFTLSTNNGGQFGTVTFDPTSTPEIEFARTSGGSGSSST